MEDTECSVAPPVLQVASPGCEKPSFQFSFFLLCGYLPSFSLLSALQKRTCDNSFITCLQAKNVSTVFEHCGNT